MKRDPWKKQGRSLLKSLSLENRNIQESWVSVTFTSRTWNIELGSTPDTWSLCMYVEITVWVNLQSVLRFETFNFVVTSQGRSGVYHRDTDTAQEVDHRLGHHEGWRVRSCGSGEWGRRRSGRYEPGRDLGQVTMEDLQKLMSISRSRSGRMVDERDLLTLWRNRGNSLVYEWVREWN